MGCEDAFPHFGFDFRKIREHWRSDIGNYSGAVRYLRVVGRRLEYWMRDLGPWLEFDLAARHLREDLHLRDSESHLTWVALQRRVRIDSQPRRKRRKAGLAEAGVASIPVQNSPNGPRDCVWIGDFRRMNRKALAREYRLLRKLRAIGLIPLNEDEGGRGAVRRKRPQIRWIWASRLLAFLFETLRQAEAICDDGQMWASLDGVFVDARGKPISRKDLSLWAHQYHQSKPVVSQLGGGD